MRELSIRNLHSELRRMSEWLAKSAREMEVDRDSMLRLDVCASEAVSNVISYGYFDRDAHTITLRLDVSGGRMTLEVEDDGRPFNPLALPDRTPAPSVDKGLVPASGLRIIRGLLPEARYELRDSKNVLILTARLPWADQPANP